MAKKILGQSEPPAATNTTLYTTPASTETVVSSLAICNTSNDQTSARVFVVPSGGSAGTPNALYYNLTIPGKDTYMATVGITLAAGDFLVVYATLATLTFHAFGAEVTI